MAEGTPLKVWFVNVGHGDCTIVKFPSGRVMMVDICNSRVLDKQSESELREAAGWTLLAPFLSEQSQQIIEAKFLAYRKLLDDPIEVMKTELPGHDVFRFVLTHPDMDHMTGLHRLLSGLDGISVLNFWDTENTKEEPDKYGNGYDERDWKAYEQVRCSTTDPKVLNVYRGYRADFYQQDGVTILSPTTALRDECNEDEDWNNISQVLRIEYGKSSLILPGDVEAKAQEAMVEEFGDGLKSTILKAPHHGRESGYYEDFAAAVSPDYTIVSVGKKPDSDASSKYRKHTKHKVFSTRFMGTIRAHLFADGDVYLWNSPAKGGARIDAEAELQEALRAIIMGRTVGQP